MSTISEQQEILGYFFNQYQITMLSIEDIQEMLQSGKKKEEVLKKLNEILQNIESSIEKIRRNPRIIDAGASHVNSLVQPSSI